jgi:hypothetical protein
LTESGHWVELHKDGSEGRIDDERHQEEEGEEAESAKENEESSGVEQKFL